MAINIFGGPKSQKNEELLLTAKPAQPGRLWLLVYLCLFHNSQRPQMCDRLSDCLFVHLFVGDADGYFVCKTDFGGNGIQEKPAKISLTFL